MTQIQAIETRYAGCRFRSRLEARWAVCLDHLGIKWQYEPEGYDVGGRLSMGDERWGYLPDFWLPELNAWAEVKGRLTDEECGKLIETAASMMAMDQHGGCCPVGFIVLGQIPKPGHCTIHSASAGLHPVRLHLHKGDVEMAAFWLEDPGCTSSDGSFTVASDYGGPIEDCLHDPWTLSIVNEFFIQGRTIPWNPPGMPLARFPALAERWDLQAAYTAARSARFEHGESG
jgi:hypothetical protein